MDPLLKKRELTRLMSAYQERETFNKRKYEMHQKEHQRLKATMTTDPVDPVTLKHWKQSVLDMGATQLQMAQERMDVINRAMEVLCPAPAATVEAVVETVESVVEPAAKRVKTEP